jgi:hypothetical protein
MSGNGAHRLGLARFFNLGWADGEQFQCRLLVNAAAHYAANALN